jgi:excisionase family DNA binding protein
MRKDLPIGERLTCTVNDACAFSSVSKTKLYELINGGALATTRVGRRRLVIVSSLKAMLGGEEFASSKRAL